MGRRETRAACRAQERAEARVLEAARAYATANADGRATDAGLLRLAERARDLLYADQALKEARNQSEEARNG